MNDDQLDDLKQFVTATLSQTEARLTERIDTLERKIDDGFAGVGEAFDVTHAHMDEQDKAVNIRLNNLEQQAA